MINDYQIKIVIIQMIIEIHLYDVIIINFSLGVQPFSTHRERWRNDIDHQLAKPRKDVSSSCMWLPHDCTTQDPRSQGGFC